MKTHNIPCSFCRRHPPPASDGQPKIWLQKMPKGLSIPSFVGQKDGGLEGDHRLKPAAEHPPGDVEWLKCSGLFMDHSFANTSSFSDVSAHAPLQRTIFQARHQNARMVVRDRCLEFSDVSLGRSSRSSTRGRYMSFNFHGSMSIREQKTGFGREELKLSHYNKENLVKQ